LIPLWFHTVAIAALVAGVICAITIAADELRHPQHMWVMNVVWPLSALFGTVFVLWSYFSIGRIASPERAIHTERRGEQSSSKPPFPGIVAKGTLHCGSGCTLGDVCAEWLAFAAPVVATWFGWRSLFGERMFAIWVLDYLLAFTFGIAFQYFTIKPMRHLSVREGLVEAAKADALSLTSWQIGMYGFMAFAQFIVFRRIFGVRVTVNTPEFWFAMQIAMLAGFATAYPVNWWLIRTGIKERM
jgi:hypothetical protein